MRNRAAMTPHELAALQEFARSHGYYWKNHLRHAWETGNYRAFDAQALQTLRNTRSPKWLANLRFNVKTGVITQ